MAKYRLSYLENGGYRDIDISKLDCLEGEATDIQTIDKLTMSFDYYSEFIRFLQRKNIINDIDINLEITIDRKLEHNNQRYNKPIFNSNKLLFSSDEELLKPSFILKNIKEHIYDYDYMYNLALNYEEKYKNAYNRITGSSVILSIINIIKITAIKINKFGKDSLTYKEIDEYQDAINDLHTIELYKYSSIKLIDDRIEIVRKKDANGKFIKNYRGIHDFVNLIKKLDSSIIKKPEMPDIYTEFDKEELLEIYNRNNYTLMKRY